VIKRITEPRVFYSLCTKDDHGETSGSSVSIQAISIQYMHHILAQKADRVQDFARSNNYPDFHLECHAFLL